MNVVVALENLGRNSIHNVTEIFTKIKTKFENETCTRFLVELFKSFSKKFFEDSKVC